MSFQINTEGQCKKCGKTHMYAWIEWCKPCQIDSLKANFITWTSGDEIIDGFIQEMQLKFGYENYLFEWIPYNQFNDIKEVGKGGFTAVYLAIWGGGPLYYNKRNPNKLVVLKCLYNTQNITDQFLNEVKEWDDDIKIYGISQNPVTNDYIIVFEYSRRRQCKKCCEKYTNLTYKWCKTCEIDLLKANFANWSSRNEKIDDFIQEKQLNFDYESFLFEWIPYNQFNSIKEISKAGLTTLYLAIWKDGPLYYNYNHNYERNPITAVALKCLYKSQNFTNEFLNEIKGWDNDIKIYGISQNPDTKDYIMVLEYAKEKQCKKCGKKYTNIYYRWCKPCQIDSLKANFTNWTSGNEKIDEFIQEKQLKIDDYDDIIFEWIPYNQFNDIKEMGKSGFATAYLALWKNGPPYYYDYFKMEYKRYPNKKVVLKCLYNSQNITNEFLNEIKGWDDDIKIYGISQNPDTNNYIVVLEYAEYVQCKNCCHTNIEYEWCMPCHIESLKANFTNWTSGDKKIDNFIQEMQLKIFDNGILLEWIPYNKFNGIKKISKDYFATIYSAVWENGPPHYYDYSKMEYKRNPNKKVILKYLHNSTNDTNKLLNEVKEWNNDIKIYGISQNPGTKNYIMVLEYSEEKQCKKCVKQYTFVEYKWCKPCQVYFFKKNFTNWTSGKEKIDDFIQEMQLKINHYSDIIFEWIPYNQFNIIKKIGEGGFATVYLAIWKDGPLYYDSNKQEWTKESNKQVALKCLNNSKNIADDFLNEVKAYSIKKLSGIIPIYGMSQNPKTKDYVMILHYAKGGNFNDWIKTNYKNYFKWNNKLITLKNIVDGLKEIHQKQMVHRDFHPGNILFSFCYISDKLYISDMGLCGIVGNLDEKNICGVMPYMAPEVLRGKSYTKAADIYSFGMIMHFVATGRQPFDNIAHDHNLALDICNGIRPEIHEPEAPKCYIDLMKKCWDSNPDNRPNARKVFNLIDSFSSRQFGKAEEYRKANLLSVKIKQLITHPQAIYTSRLLNIFTKDLLKYDDNNTLHSECLDCIAE